MSLTLPADVDLHPHLPSDDPVLESSLTTLRFNLLLNSSLTALKSSKPTKASDARLAIKQATRALDMGTEGKKVLTEAEKGKALFRRAMGYKAVKEEDNCEKDFKEATTLVPGDAGIANELSSCSLT